MHLKRLLGRLGSNGFLSLKKVQGKKKRDAEATEAARKANDEAAEASVPAPADLSEPSAGDLLSSKDEDVIF